MIVHGEIAASYRTGYARRRRSWLSGALARVGAECWPTPPNPLDGWMVVLPLCFPEEYFVTCNRRADGGESQRTSVERRGERTYVLPSHAVQPTGSPRRRCEGRESGDLRQVTVSSEKHRTRDVNLPRV